MRLLRALSASMLLAACQPAQDPAISKAQEAVKRSLKDSASAQFRDVTKCKRKDMVLGEVNAKNGFGALTGFTHFATVGPAVYVYGQAPLITPALSEKFFLHLVGVCYKGTGDPDLLKFIDANQNLLQSQE